MSGLYSVLQNHYPVGENINAHFPRILGDHMEDVLNDLPRRLSLPMPGELAELEATTEGCPVVIEEDITISAIQRHLLEADQSTPEIGVNIFGSGLQVLNIISTQGIHSDPAWKAFQKRAVTDFHTHPNPTETEFRRNPSFHDLSYSLTLDQPIAIGSHDGLTYVPKPKVDRLGHNGYTLWTRYVQGRGFDEKSFNEYGADKLYTEFVADIVRPSFIGWGALSGETTLADAIAERAS